MPELPGGTAPRSVPNAMFQTVTGMGLIPSVQVLGAKERRRSRRKSKEVKSVVSRMIQNDTHWHGPAKLDQERYSNGGWPKQHGVRRKVARAEKRMRQSYAYTSEALNMLLGEAKVLGGSWANCGIPEND